MSDLVERARSYRGKGTYRWLLDDMADRIEALEAENSRAWRERNEAYAMVKGWEATVYVEKLPLRAVPINDWGPGGEGQTTIPDVTPQKLTELLDELATLRATLNRSHGDDNT